MLTLATMLELISNRMDQIGKKKEFPGDFELK